ncbi:MAG: BamA/TamA family outer membrane protein [Prochloraceae cyanobacterium]
MNSAEVVTQSEGTILSKIKLSDQEPPLLTELQNSPLKIVNRVSDVKLSLPRSAIAQEQVPSPPEPSDRGLDAVDEQQQTPPPPEPEPQAQPEPRPPAEPRVIVAEVIVSGVEGELQDLVYNTIETKPGRTTTRSRLQEDVNAVYARGFFANVRVVPEDTPLGVRITFIVQPNPTLTQIVIEPAPADEAESVVPPEVVQQIFGESYGQILNLRDLQQSIQDLNKWYTDNGYDLAQVVAAPEVTDDGTVTLVIAEGVIEDIQVQFFDEEDELITDQERIDTRPFIVTREVQLKPGDVFNRRTAQRDLQRVFGLGIFEDTRLSFSPGQDPRKVIVNIDVVESSTGSLSAGGGYSTQSGVFGSVGFREQNLGGNNQTLGIEFQIGERDLFVDANFTDPWIGGDPYRTSYTVNGFRRRSISLVYSGQDTRDINTESGDRPRVVRTGGGVNFSRPLAPDPFTRAEWRLTAGFQYQNVRIEDSDSNLSPQSEPINGESINLAFSDSGIDDLFFLRFRATRDLRDNALQPTSGSVLRLSMDQSLPIGSGSILLNRVRGSYSYYIPVKWLDFSQGPQALAFNVQAGTVMGDLPPYESFVLGGSNSVRGYADGAVGSGRSFFKATAEYRFPIVSFVGGGLFFDYGTDLGSGDAVPGNPSGLRDLPGNGFGYGIGVRIRSPLGPIRIDFGINDNGDSRINFGIGERF